MQGSEQPKATLDDLLTELKAQRDKSKDFWDRLAPASAFISSVVLGVLGLWLTHDYNVRQTQIIERQSEQDRVEKQHQARILEMQAVEKFVPYLTTDDERQKEVALLVISTLGSPEFATQFAKLNPSKGTLAATDRIMATATSASQTASPVSVTSKPPIAVSTDKAATVRQGKTGWVYLGQYVAQDKRWETRYFDFSVSTDPSTLVSSPQVVRIQTGNINVRVGMPTESGEFLKVREILKPGSQIKIKAVKEWSSTGYMWAEVDYET